MCYTLTKADPEGNSVIHVFLNASLTYIVFVHDPEFFLYTYNPQVGIFIWAIKQLLGEDGISILNHNAKTHTAILKQWERDCFSCNITQAVPMTAWVIPSSKQFFELSLVDTHHRLF